MKSCAVSWLLQCRVAVRTRNHPTQTNSAHCCLQLPAVCLAEEHTGNKTKIITQQLFKIGIGTVNLQVQFAHGQICALHATIHMKRWRNSFRAAGVWFLSNTPNECYKKPRSHRMSSDHTLVHMHEDIRHGTDKESHQIIKWNIFPKDKPLLNG